MKNAIVYAMSALLLVMTAFCTVGFAAVNDSLQIGGTAQADPPRAVFITDVEVEPSASGGTALLRYYAMTNVDSIVTLGATTSADVRLRITVQNNAQYAHTFDGIQYTEDRYSNSAISVTTVGITKGDEIAVGQTREFFAVFKYAGGVPADRTLESLLNFSFVLSSEFVPDAAVGNAVERFEEILNNEVQYGDLVEAMGDVENSGRPDTEDGKTYIGNVIGSSGKDSEFIRNMFQKDVNGAISDCLALTVGDQTVEVTVIMKTENADGDPNSNDMTLYLTPDTPSANYYTYVPLLGYQDWQHRRPYIRVYAVVFRNVGGTWTQVTPLFEGKARETVYGSPSGYDDTCDSFNTNMWESTQRYYSHAAGANIKTLTATAIQNGYSPEN